MAEPVWHPSPEFVRETRLYRWMQALGFDDYDSFYAASIRDVAWFWGEAEKASASPGLRPTGRCSTSRAARRGRSGLWEGS